MPTPLLVSASVAGADQAALGSAVVELSRYVDIIHIDIEDGAFSPNLTLGPAAVRDLRPYSALPFEVHLMVSRPEDLVREVARAGADSIVVNVEACPYPLRVVRLIRSLGKRAGLAFNWGTPLSALPYLADELDSVLLLTSEPDLDGQRCLSRAPERVAEAGGILTDLHLPARPRLIADGGLNADNVAALRDRGADEFVVGRYLWQGEALAAQVAKLKAALEG